MTGRYLAAVALGRAHPPISPPAGLRPVLAAGALRLWASADLAVLSDGGSAILGALHGPGDRRPRAALDSGEWRELARTGGRMAVERFWGDYVALLGRADGAEIVRGPFGALSCFLCASPGTLYLASDLGLLLEASGLRRRIVPAALAAHIARPEWRHRTTCLDAVHELRGGDALAADQAGMRFERLWSPWRFARADAALDDPDEAIRRVRDAVLLATGAAAARFPKPLLLLSGGLDSSIVAAGLASAGADFTCLNLTGTDRASDEQAYARMVAEKFGRPLLVESFDPADVDLARSDAAHLPYPVHRAFTQSQDRAGARIARSLGAAAVLDGGGGDNVFFGSRTVATLADCLSTQGFDSRYWRTARALGDLSQTGLARLTMLAVRRAMRRTAAPRLAPRLDFLSRDARQLVRVAPLHPWFDPPKGILPGRAAHAALLVPAQNLVEAVNAGAAFPAASPLASRPVVEACLRAPSWQWLAPGRNRAAARAAFAGRLPPEVVGRRSKGELTGFVARLFDDRRAEIRDLLLGGRLAQLGLIDAAAIARTLGGEGPARDHRFLRLMELVDAEAWARAQG
jgi:asparagine synthase (glutamine-hydrolysing)